LCAEVMKLAHSSLLAGYLGVGNTLFLLA